MTSPYIFATHRT